MSAGMLSQDYIVACRSNEGGDETLEGWINRALSCDDAELDAYGFVFAAGRWLTQDECDSLAAKIDAGV